MGLLSVAAEADAPLLSVDSDEFLLGIGANGSIGNVAAIDCRLRNEMSPCVSFNNALTQLMHSIRRESVVVV